MTHRETKHLGAGNKWGTLVTMTWAILWGSGIAQGDVKLDGTLGPSGNLPGPNYQIYDFYGKTAGTNLFHSFDRFNLSFAENANFWRTQPGVISNVIARVTGGTASSIDGGIHSLLDINTGKLIADVNFWFVNPAGVLFGPHASIDVGGSFYVSTANYLKFADGLKLDTTATSPLSLSTAPPEAFGFLGSNPAGITVQGSGSTLAGQLAGWKMSVPEGKTLALVGGDIAIRDGEFITGDTVSPTLKAQGGRVALVSVGSKGEVIPNAEHVDTSGFQREGSIALDSTVRAQGALVNTSGTRGGEIVIRGGELTLKNSYLVSDTSGEVDGKAVDVKVRGTVSMEDNGAGIYARTTGAGKGSDITVQAEKVRLSNTAIITTGSAASGSGGEIVIAANDKATVESGSLVSSVALGSGQGGGVRIRSGDMVVQGGGVQTSTVGSGTGGAVAVKAVKLRLSAGAAITSASDGTGAGGAVELDADDRLTVESGSSVATRTSHRGNGGAIRIRAGQFEMAGGLLETAAYAAGAGGDVRMAVNTLQLTQGARVNSGAATHGAGGKIDIAAAHEVSVRSGSLVSSGAAGAGAGGNISIRSGEFVVDSSAITTTTLADGNAGNVAMQATAIRLSNQSAVQSTNGQASRGRGGAISMGAERIDLSGGSSIGSRKFSGSSGDGGAITLRAKDIALREASSARTLVMSQTTGEGGAIQISGDNIALSEGATLESLTSGAGNGGSLVIHASTKLGIESGAAVSSATGSAANGGDIDITAGQVAMDNGHVQTATAAGGRAGHIQVASGQMGLGGRASLASLNLGASNGPGGAIGIDVDALTLAGNTTVRTEKASGSFGDGGAITVAAHRLDIEGGSAIASLTGNGSTGRGGNIQVDVGNLLIKDPDSGISSLSGLGGTAKSGEVTVHASDTITIKEGAIPVQNPGGTLSPGFAGIFSNAFDGDGGRLSIAAQHLVLDHGGTVGADNFGTGKGADVDIRAETVSLVSDPADADSFAWIVARPFRLVRTPAGAPGTITLQADTLLLSGPRSYVTTVSNSADRAGAIRITADQARVADGALIEGSTYGPGQGADIHMAVGDLTVSDAAIQANNFVSSTGQIGAGNAGNVTITAARQVLIENSGSVAAATASHGAGGDVQIRAGDLRVQSGGRIDTRTFAGGKAGDISIDVGTLALSSGVVTAQTLGNGNAGNIGVRAENVSIVNNSALVSDNGILRADGSVLSGSGNAGTVTIVARDTARVADRSLVATTTFSTGRAGKVAVTAGRSITVDNVSFIGSSSEYISTAEGSGEAGQAGQVELTADKVLLSDSGGVFAATRDGPGGSVVVHADRVKLENGGFISTDTRGGGNAGDVTVRSRDGDKAVRRILIAGVDDEAAVDLPGKNCQLGECPKGQFSGIYLNTLGSGPGGSLDVLAKRLVVRDGGVISAIAAGNSAVDTGGGDLHIRVGSLDLKGGGLISAATAGPGRAGNIEVTAKGSVTITGRFDRSRHPGVDNPRISNRSGIDNSARDIYGTARDALGAGGAIRLNAGSLRIENGGAISVANEGTLVTSTGGNIRIDAGSALSMDNGRISAKTARADGGNIAVQADQRIDLADSAITTSVGTGRGKGGNITVDPDFVILQNSRITANAFGGPGGNIAITAGQFIPSADSGVSASSARGINGTVSVNAPDSNIIGKTTPLNVPIRDPATLFKQDCAARYAGGQSSLAVRGMRDMPKLPGEDLFVPAPKENEFVPRSTSAPNCAVPDS